MDPEVRNGAKELVKKFMMDIKGLKMKVQSLVSKKLQISYTVLESINKAKWKKI